jgi:hypothetical protein
MFCTLADVKALLGRTDTDDDALLTRMVHLATHWMARWAGRYDTATGANLMVTFRNRVEVHPGDDTFVSLLGYPVVVVPPAGFDDGSPMTVRAANVLGDVATATPMVADADYRRDGSRLWRLTAGRELGAHYTLPGGFVQVTYCGGWISADPTLLSYSGQVDIPPDVREAAALQAMHIFRNKDYLSQQSVHVGTATIQVVEKVLLEAVRDVMRPYRFTGIG